jgi:hypothetical protein
MFEELDLWIGELVGKVIPTLAKPTHVVTGCSGDQACNPGTTTDSACSFGCGSLDACGTYDCSNATCTDDCKIAY